MSEEELPVKKKVLSVPQAAERAGLTERAAWQKIYRGHFPHRRWGKKAVVLEEELDAFLKTLPGPALDDVIARVEAATR